jgi:anti-anti-sigma factor
MLKLPQAHGPGRIIVDLSRLSSIDWWAALIMLWACRMVSRRGGTLVLASPQPAVARLLNAAGAARAVTVCQSVQQARTHRCGILKPAPALTTRRGPRRSA